MKKKFNSSSLLIFFKLFENRPNHLVNFLLENDAFNGTFLEKINDSNKLSKISENFEDINFLSIDEMNNFYKSLIDDLDNIKRQKTKRDLIIELNKKIQEAINSENYEEAAHIRDYMIKNNLKKNKT
jgi:excinuclease UvrABC helicase subunit UvrB